MDKLEKVNKALRHLYELVTIVGTFDQKEKDLFCSYIECLDKESECKQIVKELKGGEINASKNSNKEIFRTK